MKSATIAILATLSCGMGHARAETDQPSHTDAMQAFQDGAFAEAMHGWMQAASQGDARAARYVGILYDTGEGVQQDQGQALVWYKRAAELGDVPAMFNVAVCYDSGRCGAHDTAQAARWYQRAASQRFGRAEYNLALIYSEGDGVPRDAQAARSLFRDAVADGVGAAEAHLPRAMPASLRMRATRPAVHGPNTQRNGRQDDESNQDRLFLAAQRQLLSRTPAATAAAAVAFERTASSTGPNALMARYDLAWCYENGIGVVEDRQRAYALFVEVASRTDDAALRALAETGAMSVGRPSVTASVVLP
jgi:TPR repeat protein